MGDIFLLTKKEKDKLLVLYELNYNSSSTTELANKLQKEKRYIKSIIKEINDDLSTCLHEESQVYIDISGIVSFKKKNSEELLRIFYSLKLTYLEKNYEFKIFHLLLQNVNIETQLIANELFLSLSYVRRILKKMNSFLIPFGFQIYETKGYCEFKGNELSILLFIYTLMNDTYHSLPWPYPSGELPDRIDFRQSLRIILTILSYRKEKTLSIPNLDKKNQWIIEQMQNVFDFIPTLKIQSSYLETSIITPTIEPYFIFFTHICAPQVIPKEIKVMIGKRFLHEPTDITLFSRKLSFKLIDEFKLNYYEEKYLLLTYYLTVLDCFYEIMQNTTILFEKLIFPPLRSNLIFDNVKMEKINIFFTNFLLKENRTDLLINERLKEYFCGLIYTIFHVETPPIIRIHLHFTKSLTSQDLIARRLHTIYNSNTVVFVASYRDADLIITDCLNFDHRTNKNLFYFDTILAKDQWSLLLNRINQLLIDTIYSYENNYF